MPKSPPPDFFFGRPHASIGVRGGVTFARADSDWYDFVTDQLTLETTDFRSGLFAFDVGAALSPRLDLVFGVDYAGRKSGSEFRHFVDNNRLPINQTTRLRQVALTAGLRFALTQRGRELSSLAWIPRRFVPYAGGGGGVLWYGMQQSGDFVDFQTLRVFGDVLESQGWTPAVFVNGGVDLHATRHLYFTVDGRYLWASAALDEPWLSFDPLDLTGFRLSVGINVLF